MKTAFALLSVAICSAVLTLSRASGPVTALAPPSAEARYRCPMHPSFVHNREGDCPICGMKLVRAEGAPGPIASRPGAMPVRADQQKVLGIVVAPVQRSAGVRSLRVLGRVAADEERLYRLNAGASGSIRDVSQVFTGSRVRKNQVLGSFYAPETIPAIQLFILNTQGFVRKKVVGLTDDPRGERGEDDADVGRNNSSLYRANIQQRIIQLESFGVSAMQRDEIARAARVPDTIKIVAPAEGFVLARNVSPAQKFERGFEFFRIADLRKVWVLADVFPEDARDVRVGMRALVSAPAQKVTLPATVAEILPQFDAVTRTLKVRLTVDNPGFVLRPDMFVDVSVDVPLPAALTVPADAVVDSGLHHTVYVASAEGVFEPRRVETGRRSGDQVEIVEGLSPGERIVVAGTFFLDSETRMRPPSGAAAANGAALAPTDREPLHRGGVGDPFQVRASARREEGHAHGGSAR
jgi:Cu(I)/Ag(I) efflux system membrane fusion protein